MKRAISTDALETLGTIIGEGAGRDAIHLAVEPVVAGEKLHAGVDVMLMYDKAYASCSDTDNPVGIVDPFLQDTVQPGQRFWLVLYPRTITSLRHVWSHPAFPDKADAPPSAADVAASRWVIEDAAKLIGVETDKLMEALETYLGLDEASIYSGTNYVALWGYIDHNELPPGFWLHYQIVTGRAVPEKYRNVRFSCRC